MIRYNTVTIAPASHLEVGDVFAMQFITGVISGKVTGSVYCRYQLTEEQAEYVKEHNLRIPEDRSGILDLDNSLLIFGDFKDTTDQITGNHLYVDTNTIVAIFSR